MSDFYLGPNIDAVNASDIVLKPIKVSDENEFFMLTSGLQNSFAPSLFESFGPLKEKVPSSDLLKECLLDKDVTAYNIFYHETLVGGAVIHSKDSHHELLFFYLNRAAHCRGLANAVWQALDEGIGKGGSWRSATPYFLQDSINFLMRACGFKSVTYPNSKERDAALREFKNANYLPLSVTNQAMIIFEKAVS